LKDDLLLEEAMQVGQVIKPVGGSAATECTELLVVIGAVRGEAAR
jgi:hypothetical protein